MHVSSYLYRSRHAVFYFRWPLPRCLHPRGKASTIKVSLRTCEPKVALGRGRHLCYLSGLAAMQPAATSDLRLSGLIERSKLERRLDPVAERSAREWDEHFALLHEILGSGLPLPELNEKRTQKVKNILLVYPKNRGKNRATRNCP